jgi:O-acetyl-ADP-ribose deacetylase (regulator of RNase III)
MKNSKTRIDIVRGDITKLHIDAIVNAANTTLLGGGGVDGAIHRAAGPELLVECRALGGCRPGEAKLTRGYKLPTRYVIHTVGPVWTGGKAGERQTLTNCYRNSLQLAVRNGIKTIAFPAISCGAYRYPVPQAAQIAVETTRDFLATTDKIDKAIFVVTNDEICTAYQEIL